MRFDCLSLYAEIALSQEGGVFSAKLTFVRRKLFFIPDTPHAAHTFAQTSDHTFSISFHRSRRTTRYPLSR
jgi:hypothetical protein